MSMDSEQFIDFVELDNERIELIKHLIRRIDRLEQIISEIKRFRESYLPEFQYPPAGRSRSIISRLVDMYSQPPSVTGIHHRGVSSPVSRGLLEDDPPCLICGRFQDKPVCNECMKRYPSLSSYFMGVVNE